jgi:hypothetical protein
MLAGALTACGGGGGASLPATQPTPNTTNATAKMVINIPPKSAGSSMRNPHYISASTESMTVGIQANGQTTQLAEADLTPTSANCKAVTGGGTRCNISFVAPSGNNTFVITMYDQTGGKGNVLSTGDINATFTAGQTTTVALDLDGVPANLSVVLGTTTLPVGTANTTSIYVQATDADGNLIVGPGGFSSTISLAISGDTYNTLALSTTSVTAPGHIASLAYNGGTNVLSTITASTAGAANATATFSGGGAALTVLPFNVTVNGDSTQAYPYTIAAYPDGSGAAAVYYLDVYNPTSTTGEAIGTVSPSGTLQLFAGSSSVFAGLSGVTTVAGMSATLEAESNNAHQWQAIDDIAVDSNKKVYYSAQNNSSCFVLGKFNPASARPTATEIVLQGEAEYPHVDSNGNVWFLEESAPCASSNGSGFASGWGVGELNANGALTERDLGISGIAPGDMAINPDGSTMFVAEYYSGGGTTQSAIAKVNTSTLAASTLHLTNSLFPAAIAADPSGDAAWFSQNQPDNTDYYGTTTSSFASITEAPFPITLFYSFGMTYADASFWVAGTEANTGYGRISNVATGTPLTNYYALPSNQKLCDVSAADGVIWATDCEYGNIDMLHYGAPASGATATINSVRRLGQQVEPKNTQLHTP